MIAANAGTQRQRRASRPKVKTGCNNCKNRRVKCDETRPQCNNCVKSGRTCKGYPAFNPRNRATEFITPIAPAPSRSDSGGTSSSSATSPSRPTSRSSGDSPPRPKRPVRKRPAPPLTQPPTHLVKYSPTVSAPSIGLGFDPQEGLYFRLFREQTASELSGFFDSKFWTRSVLQESHSEASIRHAVVALGALYKTLEKVSESPPGSPGDNYSGDSAPDHYNFALQQYGKAITRLREALETKETRSPRTVLISIVLFTCFQSFIGDHKAAIQQIQAGLGLLHDRRAEHMQPLIEKKSDLEEELIQMFTRLAIQAKSYDMGFHFPEPYVIRLSPTNNPSSSPPPSSPSNASTTSTEPGYPDEFSAVQDAKLALDSLCERILRFNEELTSFYAGPQKILPSSIRSSGSFFQVSIENWSKAFEPLLESRRSPGTSNTQRAGICVVKMSQLMIAVLFWSAYSLSEVHFDNFIGEFRTIVELAKEIVVDEELTLAMKRCGSIATCRHRQRSHSHSDHEWPSAYGEDRYSHIKASFALDLGIVPPLFVVATKCRDRKLRREAIRLLMSSPRREGMWDSILCGRAALWIMEIEEEGLPPFIPFSYRGAAEDVLPEENQRVMVKEILFDLQKRQATLRCGTRGRKDDEVDVRARETEIVW